MWEENIYKGFNHVPQLKKISDIFWISHYITRINIPAWKYCLNMWIIELQIGIICFACVIQGIDMDESGSDYSTDYQTNTVNEEVYNAYGERVSTFIYFLNVLLLFIQKHISYILLYKEALS